MGIFSQSNLQQQQQSQQTALVQAELTVNAVKSPGIFPDERDVILTKLNMVQASAGTGTGLVNYGGQHQTVNFTPDNVLCRFKVIHYERERERERGRMCFHIMYPDIPRISFIVLFIPPLHRPFAIAAFPRRGMRMAWWRCTSTRDIHNC